MAHLPLSNYSTVRCVHYDPDRDIIYAGGSNEFGYFEHDAVTGSLSYHSLIMELPEEERDFGEMWAIFRCDNGNYVFQAKQDVFVMKPSGEFVCFHVPVDILSSALSPMGTILASRDTIYTIRGMKLQKLAGTERLAGEIPLSILPYNNKVLFATAHHGLFVYDGQTVEPWSLDITPYISEHQIFCAALQGDVLAVGTVRGGIVVKNLKTGKTSYTNLSTGLQNNTVLSMHFDALGNLWVGLDQGIAYVLTEAPFQELLGRESRYGTGYTSLIDGQHLLLGTNQGLYSTPWPPAVSATPPALRLLSGMTGQVWSLRGISGTILCGGNRGAWQIHGDACRRIEGLTGTWDFQPLEGHPDLVLCCDYHGLCVLQLTNGQWHLRNRISGLDVTSGSFMQASDGAIWLSEWQQGIYRIRLSEDFTKVIERKMFNRGNGLPTDDNNLVARIGNDIIITAADGFYRYDNLSGYIQPDTIFNRLFGLHPQRLRLQEGPQGELWAYSSELVVLAQPTGTGNYTVDSLTFRQLAPRLQHSFGHMGFTSDNRILFNTDNGFMLASEHYTPQHHPARLIIRRITSTAEGDSILYEATTKQQVGEQAVLTVPKRLNSLRVEFILPEFSAEHSVQYTCWLEGYDNAWSVVTANEKEYTRLPRGTYQLHVRSYNSASGQTDNAELTIRILPAWYETWWACLVYLLLVAFFLYIIARYVRARYERKLAQVAAERQRQLHEQETQFEMEALRRERELMQLKNDQQEMELKHKSSQLADSTMSLIRKNDMLQQMDERMEELSESVRREDPKAKLVNLIRDIRKEISDNVQDDENWDKFEQNFNLVYDNMLNKLAARFPLLKLPDRKLCAYLKMGLSSKEIASLLNTSVRSIETARYRLRKKLELEQGDNLTNFLQNFQ